MRLFISSCYAVMPSLILNETTLFYLNLSATAPNTSTSFNKIKNWTSQVAKTSSSRSNSIYVPSGSSKSSTLVPSKRTTSSSSAVVSKTQAHAQPEKKKMKLDNHDLTEDEKFEREAALSSPIKGKQRLNSKVCHILNQI